MTTLGRFLLPPFPGAVVGAAVSWGTGGFPRPASVLLLYLLILYALQLLFGLAIRALFLRNGLTSRRHAAWGGMLMVATPLLPYMALMIGRDPGQLRLGLFVTMLWLTMGAMTGLSWWLLARPAPTPTRGG